MSPAACNSRTCQEVEEDAARHVEGGQCPAKDNDHRERGLPRRLSQATPQRRGGEGVGRYHAEAAALFMRMPWRPSLR